MQNISKDIAQNRQFFKEKEKDEELKRAISRLNPVQQKVIHNYYYEGKSIKLIAGELNCSISNVYVNLNTALFQLTKQFNPKFFETGRG